MAQKKFLKKEKKHPFDQKVNTKQYSCLCFSSFLTVLIYVHLEFEMSEPQNAAHNKSWRVGGMSQSHFSSAIGADESQYYIMRVGSCAVDI